MTDPNQPNDPQQPPAVPWIVRHKVVAGVAAAAALIAAAGVAVAATAGQPDAAACKRAMTAAADKATSGDGDLVGADRPTACDGLDTTTLQRLAGDVVAAKANEALKGTALDPSTSPTYEPEATPTTPTPEPSYQPEVSDFTLALKVLDKQCYGSAGCNVEVRVDFKVIDSEVPEDGTFEVTYEVRGGDDGPVVGTIEVDAGKYSPPEEYLSTARSSSKLSVVVTSVDEV